MIVPMRHVTILSVAEKKQDTIKKIRDLGMMHIDFPESETAEYRTARHEYEEIQQANNILKNLDKEITPSASAAHVSGFIFDDISETIEMSLPQAKGDMESKIKAVNALDERRRKICDQLFKLKKECYIYKPFGEFDISLPQHLAESGVPITLFRYSLHTTVELDSKLMIKDFGERDDFTYGVLFGEGELPENCEILPSPPAKLSEMQNRCAEAHAKIAYISEHLRTASEKINFKPEIVRLQDCCSFIAAHDSMGQNKDLVWITAWMPAEREDKFKSAAKKNSWGILIREPEDSDQVPTLLRPAPGFKAMQSLFNVLGINPAYTEADVSIPFFCFFSIFFAMLVGDGGYGALILLMTIYAARKMKKAPRSPFILLAVFSIATMVWGLLSNTWFGCHPQVISNPVSEWFKQPDGKGNGNMMLVCFTLGVIHLSIARVWNAITIFPNTKFLAQVGWVGIIWFMYFTAGSIVGVLPAPGIIMKITLGISILLVACFMLKKEELKTEGANLGMLPLNIISCLGDIISYVRLFAVGLASVKVAENFNDMAVGLDLPLILKIPCMILILLLGHGLNFAMAGLSVLVHAVRLNTLEFSNHKGITWSGFAFTPFKRNTDAG
ncbi:MAG: hypothetical protein PF904_08870 [Kiritimatiellae bacterium]|jgi:V/A-type H+-transporting ATPase subunit I|nr:hypothetical protein [Kiritimatiellia bacterium]